MNKSELKSIKLWESAGYAISEAQLTADQIQQLFQDVEKNSTDAGSNRSAIGKGKDVTVAVKKAYDDLVSKVQNSGPIKDIDALYDQAAAKLKQATGGDQGVMKYIEKYRTFAKEHPIAQGLIYSALIAAAGISGVGVGGAAALGLLKMTDKLLQGEKFSTAVGKGIATGATAFAAGQVGKALQGGDQDPSNWKTTSSTDTGPVNMPGDPALKQAMDAGQAAQAAGNALPHALDAIQNNPEMAAQLKQILSDPNITDAYKTELQRALSTNPLTATDLPHLSQAMIRAGRIASLRAGNPTGYQESINRSKNLSILEVRAVIGSVALVEGGVWDAVKSGAAGVAGAVADKAKTVGHNLTTKVTADKLQSAWKQAGSPTDSEAVKQVLTSAGVDAGIIDQVYADLQIPAGGADDLFAQIQQLTPNQQRQILKMLQA